MSINGSSESNAVASEYNSAAITTFSIAWNAIISPCALAINIVVITTFIRVKSLVPKTTRLLMIHQSVIEITSTLAGLILEQSRNLPSMPFPVDGFGYFLCLVYSSIFWAIDSVLQMNNMLITLDRYFAVCFVFNRIFTEKRISICIVLTWVVGLAYNLVNYLFIVAVSPLGVCHYQDNQRRDILMPFGLFYMIAFDYGPVIFVMIFYPQMIYTIGKAARGSHSHGDQAKSKVKTAASARLVKTCLIATVVLIVTNTPDIVFFAILYSILAIPSKPWKSALDMAFKAVYPVLSPIIYSLSTVKFRSAVPVAFGCSQIKVTDD